MTDRRVYWEGFFAGYGKAQMGFLPFLLALFFFGSDPSAFRIIVACVLWSIASVVIGVDSGGAALKAHREQTS